MTPDQLAALVSRLRREPLCPACAGQPVADDGAALLATLPHRPPLQLLDAIEVVDPEARRLRARRRLDAADPVFSGHFPSRPIYPGVLLVEMIGQAGLCLLLRDGDAAELRQMIRIHEALFLGPANPGDMLEIHAAIIDEGLTAILAGQVFNEGRLRALAVVEIY